MSIPSEILLKKLHTEVIWMSWSNTELTKICNTSQFRCKLPEATLDMKYIDSSVSVFQVTSWYQLMEDKQQVICTFNTAHAKSKSIYYSSSSTTMTSLSNEHVDHWIIVLGKILKDKWTHQQRQHRKENLEFVRGCTAA